MMTRPFSHQSLHVRTLMMILFVTALSATARKSTLQAFSAVSRTTTARRSSTKAASVVLQPLVVCGPSGVGKGTIIERFMSDEFGGKDHFGFTTSHTTRAPRPGEVDGIHYHFVPSVPEMQEQIDQGLFLEHAQVHDNLYGTSWKSLLDVQRKDGKKPLLDIDVKGVMSLKALEQQQQEDSDQIDTTTSVMPQNTLLRAKYIFIAPPSLELLEERLKGRGTETAESLQRRTQNARQEVEYGMEPGNFDYILVNDNLDKACQEFHDIVRYFFKF